MKQKSLVFKSIVILSILFFLMESVLTSISYFRLRNQQDLELLDLGWTMQNLVIQEIPSIEKAKSLIGKDTLMKDPEIQQLQRELNSVKNNEVMANMYIYFPEIESNGDSKKLTLLLANQDLYDAGLKPGDQYEAKDTMIETLDQMEKEGYAISKEYTDEFGEWVSIVSSITDSTGKVIGILGIDFNNTNLKSYKRASLIESIILGTSVAILFIALGAFCVRIALRPIRRLTQLSIQVAEGDLSVEIPVKTKDEVGILSANFNTMIHNIRRLVQNVQLTSSEVTASSNALKMSADQTSIATEEITTSIQEVASGSETQMQSAMESQIAMEEMAAGIQRIAESSSQLSGHTSEVAGNAERGNAVIRQSVQDMKMIHTSVSDTVVILAQLQQRSQEIGNILGIITNIASQTNLLALNASIEAARVGEHGKGFAVVATEVRKLAELSHHSSQQISELLHGIVENIDHASTAMNTSMAQVTQGAEAVHLAGETFQDIVGALQSVNEQVHEVSAAAEQMSASSEQVAASLDELARIGRNASQNSQNVAASSEEQLAMMQEISGSATVLLDMAQDLEKEIRKFKLEA